MDQNGCRFKKELDVSEVRLIKNEDIPEQRAIKIALVVSHRYRHRYRYLFDIKRTSHGKV